jgi:hypothetical protein
MGALRALLNVRYAAANAFSLSEPAQPGALL